MKPYDARSAAVHIHAVIYMAKGRQARTKLGSGDITGTAMKIFPGILAAALVAGPAMAFAATVTNLDDVTHTLVVTEGGQQVEIEISAGDTIEICPTGCFVILPNGDREVLTGSERLEIEASRGKVF